MASLRAAVIGAGWFAAHSHIPTLAARPEVVLDGVCRLGAEELERVRAHFGFAFASKDWRDVLARRPDLVLVCSPHHLHFEQAKAALEGGAHVLCEKPMTLDPAQAWELAALAERRGLHLLVPNNHNYLPRLGGLSDRIAEGLVGEIEHVACSMVSVTRDVFVGGTGLRRWDSAFFRPDRATWQDPAAGGGFAWGQMSHSFALSFMLTRLMPERVAALVRNDGGVDIGDSAVVGFAGGANGAYSGSVAMPQSSKALMRVFIAGSRGLVTVECDLERCDIRLNDGTIDSLPIRPGEWAVDAARPVNAFVDLALGRGRNLSDGRIGAMTVATIHAMMESARGGGAMCAVIGPPGQPAAQPAENL